MEQLVGNDLGVLYWFGSLHRPWLDEVVKIVTHLGNPLELSLITVAMILGLLALRRWRYAGTLATVSLLAVAVEWGVKLIVLRPRPDVAWRLIPLPDQPSFPSGHALCSMAIYLTAGALYGRLLGARWLAMVGLVLGLAIGASRPYLGVHYPLDVIAGWTAGLGLALVGVAITPQPETPPPPAATETIAAPPVL